jgi:DNA-binding NtrC family response regulator
MLADPVLEGETAGRGRKDLKTLLEDYERSLVQAALLASRGNQRRAAAALGVLPTTLHEKLKRLGLRNRPAAPPPAGGESWAAGEASGDVSESTR